MKVIVVATVFMTLATIRRIALLRAPPEEVRVYDRRLAFLSFTGALRSLIRGQNGNLKSLTPERPVHLSRM